MLEQASNRLYIGPVLDGLKDTDRLKRRLSKVRHLEVSNDRAATMFYMNIQSWKHQPFIQRNYSAAMIQQLELDLRDLSEEPNDKTEIEWGLRQIAYGRTQV